MYGGPKITRVEDVPAEEMFRFRLADGSIASIWERWIEMSPNYLAFWNRWDPGALTPRHGHRGDHSILILSGEIRSDEHVCAAGSHIMLEYGDLFGPWVAGPEGCELYGFVAAVGGSGGSPFPNDRENWHAYLASIGVESLPVPRPTRLPPWAHSNSGHTNWSATATDASHMSARTGPEPTFASGHRSASDRT